MDLLLVGARLLPVKLSRCATADCWSELRTTMRCSRCIEWLWRWRTMMGIGGDWGRSGSWSGGERTAADRCRCCRCHCSCCCSSKPPPVSSGCSCWSERVRRPAADRRLWPICWQTEKRCALKGTTTATRAKKQRADFCLCSHIQQLRCCCADRSRSRRASAMPKRHGVATDNALFLRGGGVVFGDS